MNRSLLTTASLAVLLAACGDASDTTAENDQRSARGEVLGGTISDDMLPLDRLKSQSPPLRASELGEGEGASAEAETKTQSAEAAPVAESESAAEPEAAAAPEADPAT